MNLQQQPQWLREVASEVFERPEARQLGAVVERSRFLTGHISAEDTPADATCKAVFCDPSGQATAFFICSSPHSPQLIARSVDKARQARQALGPQFGAVVLEPVADGVSANLSWALYPLALPLTENRWRWRLQKLRLARPVVQWVTGVVQHTKRQIPPDAIEHSTAAPLASVADDGDLPDQIRRNARRGLDRLESDSWSPMSVLAHNDLWKGNLMLPRREGTREVRTKFYVIDWAGSNTEGFAVFDLLRIAQSLKFPNLYTRSILNRHCRLLQCPPEDAMCYLLTALGNIGRNLEYFPRRRYLDMTVALYRQLTDALR